MAFTSWNPLDKGSGITLSNSNLTATVASPATDQLVRAVDVQTTGKYYIEFLGTDSGGGGDTGLGVATSAATGVGMGANAALACCVFGNGAIWLNGGHAPGNPSIGSIGTNDICAFAIDIGAGLMWFKEITTSSNWNGSGTANPATGVGGVNISVLGGSLYIAGCLTAGTPDYWTINPGTSSFSGAVPSGFTAGWPSAGSTFIPSVDIRRNRTYLRR